MPNHPGTGFGTRGHPPSLTGGGGGGDLKWQEAYKVDWSAQSLHDFTSDATVDIGGIEWKCLNNGAGIQTDGLRIDGSAGLRIWPAGSQKIWDTDVSAPIVTVLVRDAVGVKTTYAMNRHAVCFQCTFTATQDIANRWDQVGAIAMNSEVGTSAGSARYLNACGFSDNPTSSQWRSIRTKTADAHLSKYPTADTALADRNLFQLIIWPGQDYIGTIVGSVGAMPADGFPDPNSWAPGLTGSMDLCTKNDASSFTLANLRVGMHAVSEGSPTDPNPIFTKCRVMYAEMV